MQEYREFLKCGLVSYFDIEEDYNFGEACFDLYATFNQRNAKYMLLKNVEIYAFTSNEYILHKRLDGALKIEDLGWMKKFLDDNLENIVDHNQEHMSSVVTFLFECPLPDKEVTKQIKKFKYYKSFKFGLKGWVNVKIMVIDPASKSGITNKLGKRDLPRFIMN